MRYALIGCGRIAANHIKAALSNQLEIVAVCDISTDHIDTLLKKYDLDAEYNRDIDMIKRLPGWPNGCYPDLILHKRGNNQNNILIIECKGWWSSEEAIQNDREKIMQFLHSERYQYLFGLQIIFCREGMELKWI